MRRSFQAQYMAFLLLFSFVLLFHFDPIDADHPSIHPGEIIVIIAVSCMSIEEIRIVKNGSESSLGKLICVCSVFQSR